MHQERHILLVVYVDDIVITGVGAKGMSESKSYLKQHFQTKNLGLLYYFLGIEATRYKEVIILSQQKVCLGHTLRNKYVRMLAN